MIQDRNDLPQYLSGIGVEIGIDRGIFSERLLRDSHLSMLYSIDPWNSHLFGDDAFLEASQRLAQFKGRSQVIRSTGQITSHLFFPESLDFVYIDSSHLYQETKEELALWWPKIKPNGLLSGHDYCNGDAVRRAVDEFVASHGLFLETTVQDSDWDFPVNSWLIRKPV